MIAQGLNLWWLSDERVSVSFNGLLFVYAVRSSQNGHIVSVCSLIATESVYMVWCTTDRFREDILSHPKNTHLFTQGLWGNWFS
ncbi:hypothetical protein C444_20651 [Haloarcula japonica DSM 6131]|uniref:Uncharacterized protein n=1 Tax=Haloarcula japonica (strain ATCC 49778 / DSM 6131 / JCM 7785 / NBRC 101032 / NCIMB 13157 / TR-1) TaxID=1227453 RepID=M0L241_HALJT|nr:hypothetical protein C444_20651 [Haloarcula japonica DSM 6131]